MPSDLANLDLSTPTSLDSDDPAGHGHRAVVHEHIAVLRGATAPASALSLRLLKIEPHLSKFGDFRWVHSGPQIGFL